MNLDICRFLTPEGYASSPFTDDERVGTNDPKEVAVDATGGTSQAFDLIFSTNPIQLDAFFIGAVSQDLDIQLYADTTGNSSMDTSYGIKSSAHKRTDEAPYSYYWQLPGDTVYRIGVRFLNASAGLTVGIMRACERFTPTYGHEWGAGRGLIDTGTATPTKSGGFGIEAGAIKPTWEFTLGDLTDEELETLFDMLRRVGETNPLLVVEDPSATDYLDARLHYCKLQRLEKYERRAINMTKWSLRLEDWI